MRMCLRVFKVSLTSLSILLTLTKHSQGERGSVSREEVKLQQDGTCQILGFGARLHGFMVDSRVPTCQVELLDEGTKDKNGPL